RPDGLLVFVGSLSTLRVAGSHTYGVIRIYSDTLFSLFNFYFYDITHKKDWKFFTLKMGRAKKIYYPVFRNEMTNACHFISKATFSHALHLLLASLAPNQETNLSSNVLPLELLISAALSSYILSTKVPERNNLEKSHPALEIGGSSTKQLPSLPSRLQFSCNS